MKKLMTFCLLLALALPMAAVEDDQVMYAGGTAPALRVGAVGRLDTTSEKSLTFESSGTKLAPHRNAGHILPVPGGIEVNVAVAKVSQSVNFPPRPSARMHS